MHEIPLEQETLVQQSKHARRSDTTTTGPSSQIHSYLKPRPDQMSSLYTERTLPSSTKSQLSTMTRLLELLHMDLMGFRIGENIERKRFIYEEAIRTVYLYIEHLLVRTLINRYVTKRRMIVQIRYKRIHPTRRTCPKKTKPVRGSPNEGKPYFSPKGLRNFLINSTSQKESRKERMLIRKT